MSAKTAIRTFDLSLRQPIIEPCGVDLRQVNASATGRVMCSIV
jgi:hypothetical protein